MYEPSYSCISYLHANPTFCPGQVAGDRADSSVAAFHTTASSSPVLLPSLYGLKPSADRAVCYRTIGVSAQSTQCQKLSLHFSASGTNSGIAQAAAGLAAMDTARGAEIHPGNSSDEDEQFLGQPGEGDRVLDDLEGAVRHTTLHAVSASTHQLCGPFRNKEVPAWCIRRAAAPSWSQRACNTGLFLQWYAPHGWLWDAADVPEDGEQPMSSDDEDEENVAAGSEEAQQIPDDAVQMSGRHAGDHSAVPGSAIPAPARPEQLSVHNPRCMSSVIINLQHRRSWRSSAQQVT